MISQMLRGFVLVSCMVLLYTTPASAAQTDHSAWDQLLKRYVTHGLVDYRGLKTQEGALDRYLASLQSTNPAQLISPEEQLAFWINAYNACVFKGVLEHYPLKSVRSVKGFFDGFKYPVGGDALTLNQIEAKSRALGDWRIHFAVVCASSSCPLLRSEAYVPERLNEQLTDQVTQFLRFPERGLRLEDNVLWVSKIFDWYATDFVPASELGALHRMTAAKLAPVIRAYLNPATAATIERNPKLSIKYLPYDWTLNDQNK